MTGFTGGTLDRADHLRLKPDEVAALAGDWRARLLRMDGLEPVCGDDGALQWGSLAEAQDGDALILLGLQDGRPRFAPLPATPLSSPQVARHLWGLLDQMPAADAALYACARSLIDWHGRHRFCAACGTATDLWRAGWGRKCSSCSAEHYPRVDPVVIMLAEHDGRVLLGRQTGWPEGRYSALAGFVEPGESIEEATARELREEAGVQALSVRYIASQPWPFPSSLMIGTVAPVASDEVTLDTTELEAAIWVTREDVNAVMRGQAGLFLPPPRFAIAHTLLTRWAAGD